MAFYSVSVDDAGNEMNRPKTSRGFETQRVRSTCSDSARLSTSTTDGAFGRYLNPAVFIEKTQEPDTSDGSMSELVPDLDLNSSGETMPSDHGRDINFVVQKTCEISKITKSDAFSNWLSGKRKMESYEQARKKEIELEQQRLIEEKKQLAEKKYQEWLAKKAQTQSKDKPERELQEYQVYHSADEDNESNRRAWEQRKQEEFRRKKEAILRENERKKQLEERRKMQADKAWKNWIAEAPLKPKPVPLNKGFLTLKGTVSDIFVNPNPWRDICEVEGSD